MGGSAWRLRREGRRFSTRSFTEALTLLGASLLLLQVTLLVLDDHRSHVLVIDLIRLIAIAIADLRHLGFLLQIRLVKREHMAAPFRTDRAGTLATVVALDLAEMCHEKLPSNSRWQSSAIACARAKRRKRKKGGPKLPAFGTVDRDW